MSKLQIGRKQYQAGMMAAKNDKHNCGWRYVGEQLVYGLQGVSDAFYKGYRDYYNRYC